MADNLETAIRNKERFETYLLGLTFAILGLSIQTARFGSSVIADSAELLAWGSLLVSGLAGLSRAEWVPELYRRFSIQDEQEEKAREARKAELQGVRELHVLGTRKSVSIVEYIAGAEEGLAKVEAAIAPLSQRVVRTYSVMKYAFVLGLGLLMLARGFGPARGILVALRR